jgi:hypothetical protein
MNKEFVKSRRVFHLKTHERPEKFRHTIVPRGNLVHRHSCLDFSDLSLQLESDLISELLVKTDIPVPACSIRESNADIYQVMKQARGCSLAKSSASEKYVAYQCLATYLLNLHRTKYTGAGLLISAQPPAGVLSNWKEYLSIDLKSHLDYLISFNLIPHKMECFVYDSIIRFNDTNFPEEMSLLHGDLNDRNVFQKNGIVSDIIDWEDALIGDPVFELASWAVFHRPDEHCILIDEYYKLCVRPEDFYFRFWTYYLRIAICRAVILHQRGFINLDQILSHVDLAETKLKK